MRKLIVKGTELNPAVLCAGESAPEKYAASELKKYLEKIGIAVEENGASPNVKIGVDPEIGRDGYRIEAGDGALAICGGNGRGVIYGVYAFLEKYAGMRFFMPGVEKLGEGDLVVDEDAAFTPIFEMRQSDWRCGNGSEDWCLKNGVNQRPIPDERGGHIRFGSFVHTIGGLVDVPGD